MSHLRSLASSAGAHRPPPVSFLRALRPSKAAFPWVGDTHAGRILGGCEARVGPGFDSPVQHPQILLPGLGMSLGDIRQKADPKAGRCGHSAVESFDLEHHQPHPPSYVGYVQLGRRVGWIVGGPVVALTGLGPCHLDGAVGGGSKWGRDPGRRAGLVFGPEVKPSA